MNNKIKNKCIQNEVKADCKVLGFERQKKKKLVRSSLRGNATNNHNFFHEYMKQTFDEKTRQCIIPRIASEIRAFGLGKNRICPCSQVTDDNAEKSQKVSVDKLDSDLRAKRILWKRLIFAVTRVNDRAIKPIAMQEVSTSESLCCFSKATK